MDDKTELEIAAMLNVLLNALNIPIDVVRIRLINQADDTAKLPIEAEIAFPKNITTLGRFCPAREMTMVEYIDKYGSKLTHREMMEAADRYGLKEADKFVKQRHPENEDAVLIGMKRGENTDGTPEVLIYRNEKTGDIFSEPEFYYEIIKQGQNSA